MTDFLFTASVCGVYLIFTAWTFWPKRAIPEVGEMWQAEKRPKQAPRRICNTIAMP